MTGLSLPCFARVRFFHQKNYLTGPFETGLPFTINALGQSFKSIHVFYIRRKIASIWIHPGQMEEIEKVSSLVLLYGQRRLFFGTTEQEDTKL